MNDAPAPQRPEQPLICLPFPLSRVDSTSPEERMMFPGNSVDKTGKPVPDPDKNYARLALEPDPNLMFEHFCEYWRKVHAPKILHRDGPGDPSTDYPVLYNQVHRLPAGPSSQFSPPYKPILGPDGLLTGNPAAQVPAYRRSQYDGMAHLCFKSIGDVSRFFVTDKYTNKIMPDEAVFLRVALVFISAQYIIIPGPVVPDPVVMVKFYQRKGGSREEFLQHLLWEHADFVASRSDTLNYVTRYGLLLNVGPDDKNNPLYQEAGQRVDAMAMMSFRNMNTCEDYLSGDDYREIERKENEFVDMELSEWFTAFNYNIFNKLGQETATDRNLKPEV